MSPENLDARPRRVLAAAMAALVLVAPVAASAIVGGSADPHPLSRASVMVLKAGGAVCTGIVLAPDIVLTAAHCASGAAHRVHYKAGDGSPVLVEPAEIRLHPGYVAGAETTRRRSVDLALVRLPSPLPASFGTAALATGAAPRDSRVTVAGYGVAREGDGRSTGTFRSASLSVVEPYGPGRILIWAQDPGGEAGACQGDSGGAISNGTGQVVAITSWARGKGKRQCGELTQGVLVAPQRAWIDGTLSHWRRTPVWN